MKQLSSYSSHDQNWHWPEKTWFRERLNAVKARENEQRRKVPVSPAGSAKVAVNAGHEKDDLKAD